MGIETMDGTLLFVDDDSRLLDGMKRFFSKKYRVLTASNGVAALRLLEETGPASVMVSDLRMPGMDGITLLSQVRKIYPDTVSIILTGFADLQNAFDAVNQCQAFRLLTKPCPMEDLAKAVGDAFTQTRLIQSQNDLAVLRKIKTAMEGIITGFTNVVEARDPYTAGHQRRTGELAEAIGKCLGMEDDRLMGLKMSALVHDIGKIYVPAEFLNKPGRLSEMEFAIIKHHPRIGHDILKPIDFTWPIAKIIFEHHERLDGSGYPRGLSNGDISLEARIIAVADTVEAMTSLRPYRAGLGLEAALAEIEKKQGVLYDSEAVRICIGLFHENRFQFSFFGADGKMQCELV